MIDISVFRLFRYKWGKNSSFEINIGRYLWYQSYIYCWHATRYGSKFSSIRF